MLFPYKSRRCEIFVRGQQFHISVIVQSVMVSFIERLNLLCKEKGISISKMIKDLGMANGNVTRWNKGSVPTGDNLTKISDYFGVSTDYLLGKTEKRQAPEGLTTKRVLSELFFFERFLRVYKKTPTGINPCRCFFTSNIPPQHILCIPSRRTPR